MISQREARRLKKRVAALESILKAQRNTWLSEWPSYVNLGTLNLDAATYARIETARRLKHAVVLVTDGDYKVKMFADPLPQ